ncbi:wax ester/triacylglycerol synthase family O-acyltransferase [Antrihabitans sp. YC2-6]|uniref:wax ester/triacylglycerol synthase family O-acyltransferase n=1 Tax=Antrihabitans sp. YC2-6 TaxID=2799498 RepID=UPI0018F46105|nr:wax ester/triacylglycerol synthase family O-acyltransferase [Antrihabitans sp. YC2-6]MBJ8343786.1 wax ester/triacylglycerol synthase family O-acyltransferase [Antrihabitans sp. YC2-6]
MADKLSPMDRSSLVGETGPVNMTIGSLIFVEPGPGVTYDALCARITERIHLVPRCKQRLDEGRTGLSNAVWVEDEYFDVGWHIRLATLPAPGGKEELLRHVGNEMSRRLDRSRPLWEMHLIDGLADGRTALLIKMHHALVDGSSAVGIGLAVLDIEAEAEPVEPPPTSEDERPGLLLRQMRRAIKPLSKAQDLIFDTTSRILETSPTTAASDLREAAEVLRELLRSREPAVSTPFNKQISANRSWDYSSAPLRQLRAISLATNRTVNDVLLAIVSGMLATYLTEAGVDPAALEREPSTLVPVSIRREGEVGGNRISVVIVELPVGERDPLRRVELVGERMDELKRASGVMAGAIFVVVGGLAPPLLSPALTTVLGTGIDFPSHNLVVSNVPGPPAPVFLNGSRVLEMYPVVPLNPADQGLNVGAFSYAGTVHFGFTGDRALDPPIDRARAAFESALAELSAAAGVFVEPGARRD